MLTPTLSSPSDLLNKLEREFWRALHHKHYLHKSDHFYNFCVTSNALKDYFFEWKKILPTNAGAEQRKPFFEVWNTVPELVAATEIANTMKHFVLRDQQGNPKMSKARVVRKARSTVVHVFLKPDGALKAVRDRNHPSITIEMATGQRFKLYEFMDAVLGYWRKFLLAEGVPIRGQSATQLYGAEAQGMRSLRGSAKV